MRATIAFAILIAAAPAVAGAQDATERRRAQAFENLRQLEQNQRIGEVERRITNLEIRQQSDASLRALQAPVIIIPEPSPYVVAGSSAATGVSPIRPMGARPGSTVTEAPLLTTPYPAPSTRAETQAPAPSVTMDGSASPDLLAIENRVRDLELAASNERLRDIAAAQRGR